MPKLPMASLMPKLPMASLRMSRASYATTPQACALPTLGSRAISCRGCERRDYARQEIGRDGFIEGSTSLRALVVSAAGGQFRRLRPRRGGCLRHVRKHSRRADAMGAPLWLREYASPLIPCGQLQRWGLYGHDSGKNA